MLENENIKEITIYDLNPAYSQPLFDFIHMDGMKTLKESATEFYPIANRYQMRKLKAMCINSLSENLSSNTIVETYELAEKFSLET